MQDERLGERACAYVKLREGATFDFAAMVAYFAAQDMAKQYVPERLEIVDELPRTPSGKIQKFKLRELGIARFGLQRAAAVGTA